MPALRKWALLLLTASLAMSGCKSWCENHYPCPAQAPYPAAYAPAYYPQQCCPAPCCTPAAPVQSAWTGGAACPCR